MKALNAFGVLAVLAVPVLASKEGPSPLPSPSSQVETRRVADHPMNNDGPFSPPTPAPTVAEGPFSPPTPAPVAD